MASKDALCTEEDISGSGRVRASSSNDNASVLNTVQSHTLDIDQLDWTRAWDNQQNGQNYQGLLGLNDRRTHNNESRLDSPSKRGTSFRVKTEQISPFTKYVATTAFDRAFLNII